MFESAEDCLALKTVVSAMLRYATCS